jgi:hypothetical protein
LEKQNTPWFFSVTAAGGYRDSEIKKIMFHGVSTLRQMAYAYRQSTTDTGLKAA